MPEHTWSAYHNEFPMLEFQADQYQAHFLFVKFKQFFYIFVKFKQCQTFLDVS